MCNETNNDDFAAWVAENEITDVRTIPVAKADDAESIPAFRHPVSSRWVETVWDRKNPGNHACHACRGTGVWSPPVFATRGKTGKCHKCQGRGHFKTSHAERAKAKAYRQLTTANKLRDSKAELMAKHAELIKWLYNNRSWNDFARSLIPQFEDKGRWSDKQIAAAQRMMDKMVAKEAAKVKEREWQPVNGEQLDLSSLPAGRYAVPGGDTRLKVMVRRPGNNSNWKGYIFVSDAAEYGMRQNYGRQAPGKLYEGKITDELKAIMADPMAASVAYGKLVGVCGVCGRKLEDEKSVAAGIGPVCAAKFGV